jgi:peptidoglycan/LPS O-acetylase OafA/YrhL
MIKKLLSIDISPNRIYGLDILRAIAILFVVLNHGRGLLPSIISDAHKIFVFDGVSIFFVLSGFLIGGILIKILERNAPTLRTLLNFWIRRWLRTLPNYFLILLLLIAFTALLEEAVSWDTVKSYFIFSQNLYSPHPSFFPEAWSLSIEEWFYLITPCFIFLMILLLKITPKQAIFTTAALILLSILTFRYFKFQNIQLTSFTEWNAEFRMQVITRLDSLMFGVIGAYVKFYHERAWTKYKNQLLFIGIAIFLISKMLVVKDLTSPYGFYMAVFHFSVTSLATLLLIPFLSNLQKGSGFIFKAITYISLISYSMYLLNFSIVKRLIINSIPVHELAGSILLMSLLKYFFFWIITIVGSILLYKYFEVPVMNLRDHKLLKRFLKSQDQSQ